MYTRDTLFCIHLLSLCFRFLALDLSGDAIQIPATLGRQSSATANTNSTVYYKKKNFALILNIYNNIHINHNKNLVHTWVFKGFFSRALGPSWRLQTLITIFLLFWLMIAYIALFSALLSRLTALACGSTWVTSHFFKLFLFISTEVVYLQRWHGWWHMKLQPSRRKFCVHHTAMHHVTSCSHIRKVYACLAVTCHLHFWQNDRDLLCATVVTRGWNGYQNKSQHRKSTLEKKILLPLQQGFEPATFQSRVRRSNHWAIPTPMSQLLLA